MPKLGVVGNNNQVYQRAQPAAPEQNPTLDFVMKLGEKYMQGKIEEKQQQMFVAGMQRTASGEALADIKKDDPPFATLFGPTATIAGASAMAKVKGVDDFVTEAYQKLPELAKMDPKTAGKKMMEGMQAHLTGDASVDTVIQSRIVEQLPVLMKAQTKANYAWVQDESSRKWTDMADAAGRTVQGAALNVARGLLNEDDFARARTNALSMLQKPDGMDDKTYRKSVADYAKLQLAQGNHWVDRWMNTRDENGHSFYSDVLDADDQQAIIAARQTAEVNTAKQYGFNQYGARIAALVGGAAGRSPAVNQQMGNDMNREYMQETGSSTGIIDAKTMTAMQTQFFKRAFAKQDAHSEAIFKQNLKDQSDNAANAANVKIATGMFAAGAGEFVTASGLPKPQADALFWEGVQKADPATGVALVVNNYNRGKEYVNPQLQNSVQQAFRMVEGGGPIGPEMDRSQQFYTALVSQPGGQAAADAYVGPENAIKMDLYNRFMASGNMLKQDAAQAAFGKPLIKGAKLDTKEAAPELEKAMAELYRSGGSNQLFGAIPEMDETNRAIINAAAVPIMEKLTNNLGASLPEAAKRAAPAILREVDILGNVAIRKQPQQQSLAQAVGASQEDAGKTMFEVMQLEAKKAGSNVDLNGLFQHIAGKITGTVTSDEYSQGASIFSGAFSPAQAMMDRGAIRVQRLNDATGPDGKKMQLYHGTVTTPDGSHFDFSFDSNQIRSRLEETRIKSKAIPAAKQEKFDPNSFTN